MRGSPFLQLFFLAAGLLLAGIPVWSLTQPFSERLQASRASKSDVVTDQRKVNVILTSSAPGSLSVKSLGRTLLMSSPQAESLEGSIEISKQNPDDLVISAIWKNASTSNAIRVEIRNGDELLLDTTFWGTNFVEDAIILPIPP